MTDWQDKRVGTGTKIEKGGGYWRAKSYGFLALIIFVATTPPIIDKGLTLELIVIHKDCKSSSHAEIMTSLKHNKAGRPYIEMKRPTKQVALIQGGNDG